MTLYRDMRESTNLILSFNFDLYGEHLFYFSLCIILYNYEMNRLHMIWAHTRGRKWWDYKKILKLNKKRIEEIVYIKIHRMRNVCKTIRMCVRRIVDTLHQDDELFLV